MAVPISNVTRRQVYSPSGAGGAGPYAFTFEILANTDIAVYKDDTLLTLTTHYTVTINSNGTGSATITSAGLALAPVSPTQYAIIGNRTISRSTDFTTGGDFFANTINDELDQQTIFAQQNAEAIQRSLTAPQTDPTTVDMTLPRASVRANKTLAFDSNGDPTTGEVIGDNRGNWAAAVAYNKRDVVKDTSNGNIYYANTSHTSTGSQPISSNADVAKWDLLVDNASSAASATAAASSASAASTSASNASSSASAASTSASNASTSASTATTQASNASTSATNASTSATSAANSAAAAASALDSFDDRYLGTKTSDPTVDNDGNALAAGALYFSTTQNVMKVYDGASWIAATAAGATSLVRFRYVATSGQTTFSGADAASATLTYTVNNTVVMRNGVTLDTSEYTASSGTSVVLNVAAGTGDIIDIIAFKSFTVSDALSATSGGTVNGAVTITGTLIANSNVGIGVTPSGWSGGYVGLQVRNASLASYTSGAYTWVGSNWYNSSGNKYIGTGFATLYEQTDGKHAWLTAASGTAGNAISFTEAMTLTAAGNLGLGITPSVGGAAANYKLFQVGSGGGSSIYSGSGQTLFCTNVAWSIGTPNYQASSIAPLMYSQESGTHIWKYAAAGTAGNAITFSEAARIDSSGNLLVGITSYSSRFVVANSSASPMVYVGPASLGTTGGESSANAMMKFRGDSSTSRSINAAGTINASGADYAEYMTKAGSFTVAKGDVVGINAQGKLTNIFADAVSFVVKSTDPSYVGGDTWGSEEALGLTTPELPTQNQATEEAVAETDEAFAVRQAQYEADITAFESALEAARQTVDRIAFSGQVPVNVTGATAGQYIIPVSNNGAIKGQAISNPTFEQYQSAVGKVIAIEADGRARIIVKVA